MSLYPFTFEPILKKIIWGGEEICRFKGITPVQDGIGESWEISQVEDNYSIVANGPLAGKSIDELLNHYKEQLVGKKNFQRFGTTFPLLVKFIDARDDLSIQVHPDDKMAQRVHHEPFGKTEMWYVIKGAAGASLYSGFSQQIDPEEYVERVKNHTFVDVLKRHEVHPGDVFFLPAGRVHAICSGCFIAEIQQTSDLTYRIYDYGRTDAQGNERELHTELAKEAIDYKLYPDYRTSYKTHPDESVELVSCPYFTTNLLDLNNSLNRNYKTLDSFVIYLCMEGAASVKDNKGNEIRIRQGQTILIPADTEGITITPEAEGVKCLETYII